MRWTGISLCAVVQVAWASASVERVFRPERYARGDTNVTVRQPIDEASGIWRKGCDRCLGDSTGVTLSIR